MMGYYLYIFFLQFASATSASHLVSQVGIVTNLNDFGYINTTQVLRQLHELLLGDCLKRGLYICAQIFWQE